MGTTGEESPKKTPAVARVRRTTREQLRQANESLKSRFTRVRTRLLFMLQSTLGAGLAFFVAHDFFGHEQPFFAPMAVIIILGLSGSDRLSRAIDMSVGGVIGVLVGTGLVDALGTGPIHMTIIIGLALIHRYIEAEQAALAAEAPTPSYAALSRQHAAARLGERARLTESEAQLLLRALARHEVP